MPQLAHSLKISRETDQAWRVVSAQGRHLGNLKWAGGVWKFKAVGYDADGGVMPGHGPLTQHHNARFGVLDEAAIIAVLSGARCLASPGRVA